jgi:threonine aldolase
MREAMARAEVGDDVFRDDPTVLRLEEQAAAAVGKEAALFMPTGTMGNQVAIRIWTEPGDEILLESRSHIYNYELGAFAVVSGAIARPIDADRGILQVEQLDPFRKPQKYYQTGPGLVSVETTHNMWGGSVYPIKTLAAIHEWSRERDFPLHMDGARVFNAAAALDVDVKTITAHCDSVMFCLSKGLGAPVGSILAGPRDFIDHAIRVRKLLGGGMRQVGVLAAAGEVALSEGPALLTADHASARRLADSVAANPAFSVDPDSVETNIVIFGVPAGTAVEVVARLEENGILSAPVDASHVRFVTHRDVPSDRLDEICTILREL